jgi:hypothetical protein
MATARIVPSAGRAQEATPDTTPPVDEAGFGQAYVFVQTFIAGSLRPNPDAGTPVANGRPAAGRHGDLILALAGHPGQTVYLSDGDERVVGDGPTEEFLAHLGFGAADPPNAALVTQDERGTAAVLVLELMNPVYDPQAGTVVYEVNVLDDYTSEGLRHLIDQNAADRFPETFGRASLFIDDCYSLPAWCYPQGSTCCDGCQPNWVGHSTVGGCWSWSKFNCVYCHDPTAWCNAHYSACNDVCWSKDRDCQVPP